jgi:Xaa-Pro aminopeptidase
VFDFGFVKDGYCSDFGRSFYFGDAPQEVRKGYEALHQGIVETVDRMHEGSMRICDLFPAVEATLDSLGYGEYLRARLPDGVLGHFIGIEVHEYPWVNPACDQPLRANMVMALEPKVWRAGEYYLRVEDVVLVGRDGTEFLTSFDRELFQL